MRPHSFNNYLPPAEKERRYFDQNLLSGVLNYSQSFKISDAAEEYVTYSADFRAQVIKSLKNKYMSIRQACTFYNISKTALQCWLKNPGIKQTQDKPLGKILNEALLRDVEQYPDDYMYERAQRIGCSKSGIEIALKRFGVSQKKDLGTSKSVFNKKSDISE
ncbi:IS630 transposase-related protein [Psychrobacter sp.]|uniref:IS630 transposase-related protein n=1 Tax=Psychrobacter sp. TaxID=56811 RepID=UPI003C74B3A9